MALRKITLADNVSLLVDTDPIYESYIEIDDQQFFIYHDTHTRTFDILIKDIQKIIDLLVDIKYKVKNNNMEIL